MQARQENQKVYRTDVHSRNLQSDTYRSSPNAGNISHAKAPSRLSNCLYVKPARRSAEWLQHQNICTSPQWCNSQITYPGDLSFPFHGTEERKTWRRFGKALQRPQRTNETRYCKKGGFFGVEEVIDIYTTKGKHTIAYSPLIAQCGIKYTTGIPEIS